MEFDTNSWIYTNTRLCSGHELRPLSIKGTIQKVPTAKSTQLLLIYELTGLSMNSRTGQRMSLFSLMKGFYEAKCLFWLKFSADNLEQNKTLVRSWNTSFWNKKKNSTLRKRDCKSFHLEILLHQKLLAIF